MGDVRLNVRIAVDILPEPIDDMVVVVLIRKAVVVAESNAPCSRGRWFGSVVVKESKDKGGVTVGSVSCCEPGLLGG